MQVVANGCPIDVYQIILHPPNNPEAIEIFAVDGTIWQNASTSVTLARATTHRNVKKKVNKYYLNETKKSEDNKINLLQKANLVCITFFRKMK